MTERWQRIARVRCPHDHAVAAEVWTDGLTLIERRAADAGPADDGEPGAQAWCTDAGHSWVITSRDRARVDAARADYAAHLAHWSGASGLARFTPWSGRDINVHAKRTLVRTPLRAVE